MSTETAAPPLFGGTTPDGIAIALQLGGMAQALERAREDRQEFREELVNVRQAINGLQQSNIATNMILADLAQQNLAARVGKLESKFEALALQILEPAHVQFVIRMKDLVGSGRAFFFKILTGWIGSAAVAGAVVVWLLGKFGGAPPR